MKCVGKYDLGLVLEFLLITLFCTQKNAQTRFILKNSKDNNVKVIINKICSKIGYMIRTKIHFDNPLLYCRKLHKPGLS